MRKTIGCPCLNEQITLKAENSSSNRIRGGAELQIGGCKIARGYLKNVPVGQFEENKHRNKEDLALLRFQTKLDTGDLVTKNGDKLRFVGRNDKQLKICGFRVEPRAIEMQIEQFFRKHQINISNICIEPTLNGTSLIAFLETDSCEIAKLTHYLCDNLPNYVVPKNIKLCRKFPLNLSGKVDKKSLMELCEMVSETEKECDVRMESEFERKVGIVFY